VSGDTQSSIATSHNVSPAAIKLANPQLSDQDYGLLGEVVQIPASCSSQTNVHITVPGDTIADIAKDYSVDLGTLEKANPQITDPSTLNPGDCLEIPSGSSSSLPPSSSASSAAISSTSCDSQSMSTTTSYTSTWTPPSTAASATLSSSSTTSYSSTAPTATTCMFTIMSSGDISCPAGQLSDGQIRLNGSYPSAEFTIANSQITDSSGRGCIITRQYSYASFTEQETYSFSSTS
jgi:LysM repeat protein